MQVTYATNIIYFLIVQYVDIFLTLYFSSGAPGETVLVTKRAVVEKDSELGNVTTESLNPTFQSLAILLPDHAIGLNAVKASYMNLPQAHVNELHGNEPFFFSLSEPTVSVASVHTKLDVLFLVDSSFYVDDCDKIESTTELLRPINGSKLTSDIAPTYQRIKQFIAE